jgi:polyferredoxin
VGPQSVTRSGEPGAKPRLTAYQRRLRAVTQLHRRRHLVQLAVVVLIVAMAVRHGLETEVGAPSVDALCPFGAVETFWTWVTTGSFISKIHASNLVVGLGLLLSVLIAGNAFCGWICPFGAVQDALTWVRRALHIPTLTVAPRVDRALRYGRFVVLAIVLVASATTLKLWFADFDPYVTLFGLHWLFEPDPAAMWIGWAILAAVLGVSVLVERAWCRYLCPLGGVLSVLGHLSILRVRRNPSACTGCDLCVKPCPVGIDVAKPVAAVSTDCIGCLECVSNCPTGGALEVSAAAPWTAWRKPITLDDAGSTRTRGPVAVAIGRRPPSRDASTPDPTRQEAGQS